MKAFLAGKSVQNAVKIYWSFNRKTRTGRTGLEDDFPYLIDLTDQSVSFWSRRNHLDCNFLVSLSAGACIPSSKIADISPHFLYPSLRGHFRNSLFHSILFSSKIFPFSLFFHLFSQLVTTAPPVQRRKRFHHLARERNDNRKSSKTHKFTFSTVKSYAIAPLRHTQTHTHICAVSRLPNQKI